MDIFSNILTVISFFLTVASFFMGLESVSILYKCSFFFVAVFEPFVILYLYLQRRHLGYEPPSTRNIANPSLFKDFWENEVIRKDKEKREEMGNGELHLYGSEVAEVQSLLIDKLQELSGGEVMRICAVDVTMDPGLLLTRRQYHEKNREFIAAGNEIHRIFIINHKKLREEPEYAKDFYRVLKLNQDMRVNIQVIQNDFLDDSDIRDFILYDDSVMIEEGHQAREEERIGDSYVRFQESKIKLYKERFQKLSECAEKYNQYKKFLSCVQVDETDEKLLSFDYQEFKKG